MDYVEAARLRGEGLGWIMRREILPNILPPLVAEFGLRFCFVFLTIAALSFLGVGIQPPTAQKARVLRVVLVRGALLIGVGILSLKALLLYALSQILLLTVLRFMDCYQHNYEVVFNLDDKDAKFPHRGDAQFEQANTYTNLISHRWPISNKDKSSYPLS